MKKDDQSPRGSDVTPRVNSGKHSPISTRRKTISTKPAEPKSKPKANIVGPTDMRLVDQNQPSQETILRIDDGDSNERSMDQDQWMSQNI